jgi:hypothetical protein
MKRVFFLLAIVATASSIGCKPSPGGECKVEAKEVCLDEKRALACHAGKWEEMSCRGPTGCSKVGSEDICDQSVAEDKETCNLADDYICTGDNKGMLQCTNNKWTFVQTCLGDRGCVMADKKVTCDNSIANVDDACREEDDYACTPDKQAALVCRGGKFVPAAPCKGPKACRITGSKDSGFKVECDDSLASAGDACEKEEHFSCTADERAILKCKNKRFEIEEKCRPKEKCQIRGGQVGCY